MDYHMALLKRYSGFESQQVCHKFITCYASEYMDCLSCDLPFV